MISSLNNFAARRTYKYVLFACAHYTITYSIFPERIQNMKKVKQILAIVGVIILVGLYVSTIVYAHDIHLCLCDHPCFDLGIQFYLQTDQKRFRRKRYCRALKNQHLNKIFCQVLILLLSYLFFCVLRYSFCVLNSLRAFCILCDCQLLNRFGKSIRKRRFCQINASSIS